MWGCLVGIEGLLVNLSFLVVSRAQRCMRGTSLYSVSALALTYPASCMSSCRHHGPRAKQQLQSRKSQRPGSLHGWYSLSNMCAPEGESQYIATITRVMGWQRGSSLMANLFQAAAAICNLGGPVPASQLQWIVTRSEGYRSVCTGPSLLFSQLVVVCG